MTPIEQPEDLRAALIEKYMDIAKSFYYEGSDEYTEREEYAPQFADEILRLCEAAALAALPEKWGDESGEGSPFWYQNLGHNKAIATAQANIHSVFGGNSDG